MMIRRPAAMAVALLSAGSVLAQTPDIHFSPTPPAVVSAMLEGVGVKAGDVVVDLGSGDGRIVIAAAERGARAIGIDIDPVRVLEARLNAAAAGLADTVTFIEGNLFEADLSQATVVTMYLSPSVNLRLRSKLLRELRPGTRVVSHQFGIEGWPPEREISVEGRTVYFWTVTGQ